MRSWAGAECRPRHDGDADPATGAPPLRTDRRPTESTSRHRRHPARAVVPRPAHRGAARRPGSGFLGRGERFLRRAPALARGHVAGDGRPADGLGHGRARRRTRPLPPRDRPRHGVVGGRRRRGLAAPGPDGGWRVARMLSVARPHRATTALPCRSTRRAGRGDHHGVAAPRPPRSSTRPLGPRARIDRLARPRRQHPDRRARRDPVCVGGGVGRSPRGRFERGATEPRRRAVRARADGGGHRRTRRRGPPARRPVRRRRHRHGRRRAHRQGLRARRVRRRAPVHRAAHHLVAPGGIAGRVRAACDRWNTKRS